MGLVMVAVSLTGLTTPPARGSTQLETAYCPSTVVAWVNALDDVDTELDFGVTFSRYRTLLEKAERLYKRVRVKTESYSCVQYVGVPAERALNAYIRAYNGWQQCLNNLTCDSPTSDHFRQRQWRTAHANIQRATNNLD